MAVYADYEYDGNMTPLTRIPFKFIGGSLNGKVIELPSFHTEHKADSGGMPETYHQFRHEDQLYFVSEKLSPDEAISMIKESAGKRINHKR